MILPLLLPLAADAATFEVCPTCTYTTIAAAARAASEARSGRSTIRIAAGEYDETETITVYGDATIFGDGSDVTIVRSTADPAFRLGYNIDDASMVATVSVRGLFIEGSAGSGFVIVRAAATVSDVRIDDVPGTAVDTWRSDLTVQHVAFDGNGIGILFDPNFGGGGLSVTYSSFTGHTDRAVVAYSGATSISITDSSFEGNVGGGAIYASGYPVISDNVFVQNSASDGGAILAYPGGTVERNLFCGNEAEYGGAVSGEYVEAAGNTFVGNTADVAGGDVYAGSEASLFNNTFVGGYAPEGGSVYSGESIDFRNNIVAHASLYGLYGGRYTTYGTLIVAYNDFWDVDPDPVGGGWPAPDSTNLSVDPMFVSYVEGGCEELDLGLLSGSLLVDAGDPYTRDEDGTVADIGASGGTGLLEPTYIWYRDADGDGYGVPEEYTYAPGNPGGYDADATDCDDTNADRYPGNDETCDGLDQDSDVYVDEAVLDAPAWRRDLDGDGFQGAAVVRACEQPEGWEPEFDPTDCDDKDPEAYPGAVEVCDDDIDQDCDGDDLDPPRWRPDADNDGFQALEYVKECEPPEGWGADQGAPFDCNDEDPSIHPGADEIPRDRYDQDCDGSDSLAEVEPEGCRGCSSAPHPSGALVLLAALVLRRRRAGHR